MWPLEPLGERQRERARPPEDVFQFRTNHLQNSSDFLVHHPVDQKSGAGAGVCSV